MLTILQGAWSKASAYIIAAAGLLIALLGAFAYVNKAGRTSEKLDQAQKTIKGMRIANRIETEVRGLSDADLDRRLRKYTRRE